MKEFMKNLFNVKIGSVILKLSQKFLTINCLK